MANDANLVLTFEIYKDSELVRREEVTAESVTIGKGPAAMLRIEEDELADLHCVINVNDDGTVQLLDLGGPGGTRVNGEAINNAHLSTGDDIGIGPLTLKIAITDARAFDDDEATNVTESPLASAEAAADRVGEGYEGSTDQVEPALPPPELPSAFADGSEAELDHHRLSTHEVLNQDYNEDVMAFLMRSGTATGDAGIDRRKKKVLEVAEVWGDMVMDIKHFPRGGRPITIGTSTGHKWRFLGLPIAWVPSIYAKLTPLLAPTLSEAPEEWKNEFYVPPECLPHDDFELFEWSNGQYQVNISDKWAGFVDIGEERHTFQELVESGKATKTGEGEYQIPIDDDTRVIADLEHVIFFGQMVFPGKKVVAKLTDDIDYPFAAISIFFFFIGMLMGIIIATSPPPPESETMEIPDRFVELLLQEPEPEDQKLDKKPEANPDAGEGAKAKKEEGKVGKKDAKMKQAKGNKVEMQKKELDKEIAENAGVLGALRDGSELDGVFGSSALDSSLTGGIGGLIGAKGTQIGSGGLGSRGSGLGGGGTAEGLGGLGTKGRGSGASGYGSGAGNFGAKGEGGIGRIGGDPIILGALDKSLIDAVIKRHMNQIRYCYQRELTKDPNLGGKVVIKFVIAKDGSVSKADVKSSTMGNAAVESCIAQRFMRFAFPEPKGGGIVIVSYPFIFAPG